MLFIGNHIIELEETDSTNTHAKQLLDHQVLHEGTVVRAFNQSHGRGQGGNRWVSAPGQNILLSLVLYPRFLAADQSFQLSMCISLGCRDFLKEILPLRSEFCVKWPNDLYVGDKKIGGILIENTMSQERIQQSVVGIGININQASFPPELTRATSFLLETGQTANIERILNLLYRCIETRYLQLRMGAFDALRSDYLKSMWRYNTPNRFRRIKDDSVFVGQILGVRPSGFLVVECEGRLEEFETKQIAFL